MSPLFAMVQQIKKHLLEEKFGRKKESIIKNLKKEEKFRLV